MKMAIYGLTKKLLLHNNCFFGQTIKTITLKYSSSTYCAWQIDSFSPNLDDCLKFRTHLSTPTIRSPDEVLISVNASSVNPLDVLMCQGYGNELLEKIDLSTQCKAPLVSYDRFPLTMGRDFSGTIVAKGSKVNSVEIGDQVWGAIPPYSQGAHGQFTIAKDSQITLKPRNLEHVEAASLPYASLTALAAIQTFGGLNETNCAGKRVLILGGSGGVGSIAIQILKNWGTYVATTCSSDAVPWIQEITDVDQAIDYRSNDLSGLTESFDYVFDFAKRSDRSSIDLIAYKCLKKKLTSAYVTVTSPLLRTIDEKGLVLGLTSNLILAARDTINGLTGGRTIRWAFYHPSRSALLTMKRMVEEEKIKAIVEKKFNFEQLPQAYLNVQDGHLRGKTVIQIQ